MCLNRKTWLVLAPIALLLGAIVVAGAQTNWTWIYPTTVKGGTMELAIYLEDEQWLNGTSINYGTIYPEETLYYNFTVQNLCNTSITVYFTYSNLPVGFTYTWTGNATTLDVEESVSGWLNLTAPESLEEITYSWNSYIKG